MDELKSLIESKLVRYNLTPYDQLDKKTKYRLKKVEEFIVNNMKNGEKLVEQMKELKLSKSKISKEDSIGFTRKTLYNDIILNKYIEKCIEEDIDYFNIKKIKQLNDELRGIRLQYDNVIDEIICNNLLKFQIKEYKKEIQILADKNEKLQIILREKEQIITNIKTQLKLTNKESVKFLKKRS